MDNATAVNYHVKLRKLGDLENFSRFIKDAVVERIGAVERFTGIRLAGTKLEYNDWLHASKYGVAKHKEDKIEIGNTDSALQIAGTIIHELGHMMVGHGAAHGPHWSEACKALGLLNEQPIYTESDFTEGTLEIIQSAIARFAKEYPALVYQIKEIPWPSGIGQWTCVREHDSFHECYNDDGTVHHWAHILQYQDEDIHWLLECEHNILHANEMGTGKTVEIVGYINAVHPKRILIGCPNNAKLVWRNHLTGKRSFCVHNYEVEVAYSNLYMFSDVVIMNYEALAKWGPALAKQQWDLVIYDEGHYLKNPSAQRSKAAYKIHGSKEIIVTGSPIVNYPYEIFPLAHYLYRDGFPDAARFDRMYGGRGKNRFGYNLNHLNAYLRATIMIRRFKKDVLAQLPKKRRQVVEFEVAPDIRKLIEDEMSLYHQMQRDVTAEQAQLLAALKNESDVAADDVDWAHLIESLQSTKRFAFEQMAEIAHRIGLAKLPYVIEHLENALEAREKVVVFGHHRDVLTAIAKHFEPHSVLLLGGNTSQSKAIMDASSEFNDNDECRLFVAGIKIAQSYSLIGSSTVVFCEQSWVPGDHTQAEDRVHGIGRGDASATSMLIQHLVFEDSLDTKKAQKSIRKQKSIDRATGSGARI